MIALVLACSLVAAGLRWLRVAQREHYLASRTSAIALLWYRAVPLSWLVAAAAYAACVVMAVVGLPDVVETIGLALAVAVAALPPLGLAWRGRERPLAWTSRVRRLTAAYVVLALVAALVVLLLLGSGPWAAAVAIAIQLLSPAVMDLALMLAAPVEKGLSAKFVRQARDKVSRVDPTIVGITGSYGKTTTKGLLLHLLSGGSLSVQATPGSFNNLMGISRSINEGLVLGTDVFIAEMGTYGRGEIARLVDAFPVDIACITAIGDVHLERMGSRANIATAKSEIMTTARRTVLCIDYPELADLAGTHPGPIVTCSGKGSPADVSIDVEADGRWQITAGAESAVIEPPASGLPAQAAACAVALALCLDQPFQRLADRLSSAPSVSHRAELTERPGQPAVIDDTFNSNLDGATHALTRAVDVARQRSGKGWVVTPGMVELGSEQADQNAELARRIHTAGATLVVVGRTNRAALVSGAGPGVQTFASRAAAADYVFANADRQDVILFENDLPDHYP